MKLEPYKSSALTASTTTRLKSTKVIQAHTVSGLRSKIQKVYLKSTPSTLSSNRHRFWSKEKRTAYLSGWVTSVVSMMDCYTYLDSWSHLSALMLYNRNSLPRCLGRCQVLKGSLSCKDSKFNLSCIKKLHSLAVEENREDLWSGQSSRQLSS